MIPGTVWFLAAALRSRKDPGAAQAPIVAAISFERRVAAQRALEEVRWRHRIWPAAGSAPKPGLDRVLPIEALRSKVRDGLDKSSAVERIWGHPITDEELGAEVDRMVRSSRDPGFLEELFAGLDHDPTLIRECLARPILADRLIRSWYAQDSRFHGTLRARVRRSLAANDGGVASMKDLGGEYSEATYVNAGDRGTDNLEGTEIVLSPAEWSAWIGRLAERFDLHSGAVARGSDRQKAAEDLAVRLPLRRLGALEDDAVGFSVLAVLEQGPSRVRVASVTWRKRSFDDWWAEVRSNTTRLPVDSQVPASRERASGASHIALAAPAVSPAAPTDGGPCSDDTWRPFLTGGLDPRQGHTAVWTGTQMIVWGGYSGDRSNSGSRYTLATDSWASTSTGANVPSPRQRFPAVWTGSEMIVWGGFGDGAGLGDGGRYDPSTDAWTTVSTAAGRPSARWFHTAVWTGTEMIVWGGNDGKTDVATGARYDPLTDTWTPMSVTAGTPAAREQHTAVWTGSEMLVWGGTVQGGDGSLLHGAAYVPSSDTWYPISATGEPDWRYRHTAVWTGTEMIVWGGSGTTSYLDSGGRYAPATDTWVATATGGSAPQGRELHTAVWTGSKMIVWGGSHGSDLASGGLYDPSTDTWAPTSTGPNVPDPREAHSAIWTGHEMIVWGGYNGGVSPFTFSSGGRYDPLTDSWIPTSGGANVPTARTAPLTVWTGGEMIVWGGDAGGSLATGFRYDPATDSWTPTSRGANAPEGRSYPTAVWSGTEMILWGGLAGGFVDTGARYNPMTDTWTPTSTGTGDPQGRRLARSVWTGTEMIVWGGYGGAFFNTGGRYNPVTDSWTPTSTGPGVPDGRHFFTAVWTGTDMIVWGGFGNGTWKNTGGRYNPATDSWAPTSTGANVPSPRDLHIAVWTGKEMIVWGGGSDTGLQAGGGRYDPTTDSWKPVLDDLTAPTRRTWHSGVWTGLEMIVWGGVGNGFNNTGGRYDPSADSWNPTLADATAAGPRYSHVAVWTGKEMLVWGGAPYQTAGGAYCAVKCPATCVAIDSCHDAGVCDPTTGLCSNPVKADGTACDDGNACTYGDSCQAGACVGTAAPVPGEVQDLMLDGAGPSTLSWSGLGAGFAYDVVSGLVSQLVPDDGVGSAACLVNDELAASYVDTRPEPSPDNGYYYLVRAQDACGTGTYGFASFGTERKPNVDCP